MTSPRQIEKYKELMEQACEAMIEAAKVKDRIDLTDGQKHELWVELTQKSVDLHNRAAVYWKAVHGSNPKVK